MIVAGRGTGAAAVCIVAPGAAPPPEARIFATQSVRSFLIMSLPSV